MPMKISTIEGDRIFVEVLEEPEGQEGKIVITGDNDLFYRRVRVKNLGTNTCPVTGRVLLNNFHRGSILLVHRSALPGNKLNVDGKEHAFIRFSDVSAVLVGSPEEAGYTEKALEDQKKAPLQDYLKGDGQPFELPAVGPQPLWYVPQESPIRYGDFSGQSSDS